MGKHKTSTQEEPVVAIEEDHNTDYTKQIKNSTDIEFLRTELLRSSQLIADFRNRDRLLEKLIKRQEKASDKLEEEHDEAIEKLEKKHENEFEKIQFRHEQEFEELEDKHEKEMESFDRQWEHLFSDE